jgi:hypothetical protein
MAIKITAEGGLNPVVVFCDHCGERIEDDDATYQWNPDEADGGADAFFTHRRCFDAFRQARRELSFWGELIDFPIYLGRNLGIDWREAEAHADEMGR